MRKSALYQRKILQKSKLSGPRFSKSRQPRITMSKIKYLTKMRGLKQKSARQTKEVLKT